MNVEVARPTSDTPLTEQEQERRLADVVLAEQARSAILVAVDGNRAVMARGRRPNHVLQRRSPPRPVRGGGLVLVLMKGHPPRASPACPGHATSAGAC